MRGLYDFVIFERVEVVLDVQGHALLRCTGAKERIGRTRGRRTRLGSLGLGRNGRRRGDSTAGTRST
jgi:hypothetical protein